MTEPLMPPADPELPALEEGNDLTWSHPSTLGLTALVVSSLLLITTGVLTGRAYAAGLLPGSGGDGGGLENEYRNYALVSSLMSALFFVVPLYLARKALDQLVPADGAWSGHIVRAATLISGLGLLLGLARLLVVAVSDPSSAQLF
ncbi:MAG TPA: hypothetical protein VM097_01845 [Mycobacteriales bacterium]|nr:hypothetical protein [Mycobacteriales bacterium]